MDVPLTPELERLIRSKVDSGQYGSASEVVSDALRLLAEQDRMRDAQIATLRAEIEVGVAQARRGELEDGEAVFDRLDAELADAPDERG